MAAGLGSHRQPGSRFFQGGRDVTCRSTPVQGAAPGQRRVFFAFFAPFAVERAERAERADFTGVGRGRVERDSGLALSADFASGLSAFDSALVSGFDSDFESDFASS